MSEPINREICEFLGIEPSHWVMAGKDWKKEQVQSYRDRFPDSECNFFPRYPDLSSWAGFGLIAEKLGAKGILWMPANNHFIPEFTWAIKIFSTKSHSWFIGRSPESLPQAMVSAVHQFVKERNET